MIIDHEEDLESDVDDWEMKNIVHRLIFTDASKRGMVTLISKDFVLS